MLETDTEVAINFEAISPEVANALREKDNGDPVFAKNRIVSVSNAYATAASVCALSDGDHSGRFNGRCTSGSWPGRTTTSLDWPW